MKYRKRILLSFASVLFLPLILNDALIFTSIRDRELSTKREYISGQVRQLRGTVDYFLNRVLSDFVFLSYKRELRDLKNWYATSDYRVKKKFLDDLNPFSMLSDYYDDAYLINPEDDIMIDLKNKLITPVSGNRNSKKIESIVEILARYGEDRELFINTDDNPDNVGFLVRSIPIYERGTRMILYIDLSDKFFKGVLDDIFLIDHAFAAITTGDGTVITFRSRDLSPDGIDPSSFGRISSAAGKTAVVESGGEKFLVCSEASPDLLWSYHYGISFASVDGAIWGVLLRYSLVSAGILLAFSIVVQFISRGMYKPVLDISGLFHEDGGRPEDDELKEIQVNIRNLVARNRELSVSAEFSVRHERETVLKTLIRDGGRSEAELAASVSALKLDIPSGEGSRYMVCAGLARFPEQRQMMYADAFYGNRDSELVKRFVFPEGTHFECFMADERHFVFILGYDGSHPAGDGTPVMRFGEPEGQSLFVGVSGIHTQLGGIRDAFREALVALEYRSLFKGQSVVNYEDALQKKKSGYFYPLEIERKIVSFIKQLDREGIGEQFSLLRETVATAGISFANMKRLYLHLFDSLVLVARDFGISMDSTGFGESENLWDRIEQAESSREIEDVVISFSLHLVDILQSAKESPTVALANAVKTFVDGSYTDRNLSLDLIADTLRYSISHVSTVFKDTFGETVKDYITGLRLTRACELLVKTDRQISRIGSEVGYDNLGSFVKIFKAYLGETPKGYRLRLRGK